MCATTTYTPVVLEPESRAFVEATATPPFLYELTPGEARKVLDDAQAAPIDKLPVDERWITVPAEVGDVRVRIVRPSGVEGTLPVILYMTAAAGSWATPARVTGSCASWPAGPAPRSRSSSTTARPRPATRSRSSRATRRPGGSSGRARRTGSTQSGWRWPATRSAAA